MNINNNDKDFLEGLFEQLPEKPLPVDFRERIMRQIAEETVRVGKRNERLSWIALIAASILILGLGVVAFLYMGMPRISLSVSVQALETVPFYVYIASLTLLLLLGDYLFRKKYRKKHENNEG